MNDRIQLSFAQAPATVNQNGSFRFFDTTRAGRRPATRAANALLGLFDDYTEFGNKPQHQAGMAMAYDVLRAGQLEADRATDAGARPALLAVAAVGHDEPGDGVVRLGASTIRPTRAAHRPRRRLRRQRRSLQRHRAAGRRADRRRRSREFPQLAGLQRLYHGVPNGFSETPKDGFQPRLGLAYAINDRTTFRTGVGRFLNRVQINTTAAYGFNPPLSEMQTVINGIVGRARRRRRRATSRW